MSHHILEQLAGYIAWKNVRREYLGCNQNLAAALGLQFPEKIIGLTDKDLPDFSKESYQFHRANDQLSLQGITVTALHQGNAAYRQLFYYLVKKPCYDPTGKLTGIIYHCQEFHNSRNLHEIIVNDKHLSASTTHYRINNINNPHALTKRELQCLFYVIRGYQTRGIAELLGLSKRTVEFYIDNIKAKFNAGNKSELISSAIQAGYLNFLPAELAGR